MAPPKVRRPAGETAAALVKLLRAEDPENPLKDAALAAMLGITESAVSAMRRRLRIGSTKERASADSYTVAYGMGFCFECARMYRVPAGEAGVTCPEHGYWCPVTQVYLVPSGRRPPSG